MITSKGLMIGGITFWLAAILEIGVARHLALWGLKPDFLLVAASVLALLSEPRGGAAAGFFSGLIQGALAGANLTHYVISRTLSGFLASLSKSLGLEMGLIYVAIVTVLTTIIASGIFLFLAPPPGIGSFIKATIGTALMNGLLAMPTYALLKRIFKPKVV